MRFKDIARFIRIKRHIPLVAVADALATVVDAETLVVVSSDFVHYGWRFAYEPFPAHHAEQVRNALRRLDMGAIDLVCRGDAAGFRAYVDTTGARVAKGQPLFTLYSPDLLATQNEYLLALKTREQLSSSSVADTRAYADRLVAAARQRLELWDLASEAIAAIEKDRQPRRTITFRSAVTGYVIEKRALKGLRVAAGESLYRVADLSVVWVEADIYESELAFARPGLAATVTVDAYPGETFTGRIGYVSPLSCRGHPYGAGTHRARQPARRAEARDVRHGRGLTA